jgi:signal transduction histidine kinase
MIAPLLRLCTTLLGAVMLAGGVKAAPQQQYRAELDSLTRELRKAPDADRQKLMSDIFLLQYAVGEIDSCMATLDRLILLQADNDEEQAKLRWNKIAILNNSARNEQLCREADVQREWFGRHALWDRYYQVWHRKVSALRGMKKQHTAMREAEAMLDDAKSRDNTVGRAMALKTIATSYSDIHQFDQAKEALSKAIELLRGIDERMGMQSGLYDQYCQVLGQRAEYAEELKVSDEWLRHLYLLSQQKEVGSVSALYSSAHLARAQALSGLGRYDEAEQAIDRSEEYNQQNPTLLARYYCLMQRAALAMTRGNYKQALLYTDTIMGLSVADTMQCGLQRANVLMQVGRTREAAEIYRTMYVQKDTTFTHEMRAQLDEMNTLYHLDELEMKASLDRSRAWVAIVSLVAVAMLLFGFFRWRSVHQLRQKNEELRVANAKAEESSQMKTQFIHNISHEIRTPLNILSGFAQVIASPDMQLSADDLTAIRNDIVKNTDRITSLVNKMLELADVSSHTVIECEDSTSALDIATSAIDASHIRLAEHVEFVQNTAGADVPLTTNRVLAARALTLLLDNAKKFLNDGQGRVTLTVDRADGKVLFVVEDDGKGVPANEAERIFEEFVQLDDYYDGTGIGLTVARSLVRRMGGNIVLDTSYTDGARFVMSLPERVAEK